MSKTAIEHVFGSTYAPLISLGSPTNVSVTNLGSAGSTTYTYYVTAYNSTGETLSTTVITTTGNASLSSSNFNRITWTKVWGATGYKIYTSAIALKATTTNLHYDDTGGATSAGVLPVSDTSGYNPLYASAGTLMYQSSGAIGPLPVKIGRPMQESTAFQCGFVSAISWSPTVDWVFVGEASAAATTRRIHLYEFSRSADTMTWTGFVTITYPITGNQTIRGLCAHYEIYTTGTVAVSGTAVTGTGTTWTTDRICAGSRIGFGSTDPNQISTWYEISTVGGNTSITLTATAGTINANSVYCIEDLKIVTSTTNSTPTNGGLFVSKGLKYENFTSGGTTISAATTADNVRAVYWLADASTVTNTAAIGCAAENKTSWQTQYIYVPDGTSSMKVYKYNLRASLSGLSSGKSTSSWVLTTGVQSVTGTASQINNTELVTANHGPGYNIPCLYFTTTTRLYRAELSDIVNGSTVWISDCMAGIAPGGSNTFTAGSTINSLDYSSMLDRFILYATTSQRNYITRYGQGNLDTIFCVDSKQLDQSTADGNSAPHPHTGGVAFASSTTNGMTYAIRQSSSQTLNILYAVPWSACYTHGWNTSQDQYIITSAIGTPNNAILYRAYVNTTLAYGGSDALMIPPEPIKVWYRTHGIADNTGRWNLLSDDGLLSSDVTGKDIQFRIAFKVIGGPSLPAKVHSVTVVYEDETDIPAHLQWNLGDTSTSDGTVGFIQKTSYGSVPDLQISYYRTDTDELLFTQSSLVSTYGAFEYWNGSAWAAGLDTDTVGKRRRFRPTTGILTGINVYCKLKVI